ncbi:L-ascorbate metabolism protein UlaG (beta-lactamase superfamily) [Bacillus ectoiniformans]|uniref:metal-dependent hydrolase n=1 Tax=Bacillus ectoiniformans TaxID=1494429 RepID=UPI00195D06F2|nr:metal-dependent hydrolase [Bacillus ectoiniformans]MBM7648830.1 L-ascorbate metabolism protein UlaG (beta-lactamase superfamily) [Bacillus ectoiniformans]
MRVSYHGHSIVKIETNGKTILIDPFITGNELTDLKVEEQKPDYIVLTHGHGDHIGDTVEIAKQSGALVIAVNELAIYLQHQGLNTHPMHIGGSREFDFGKIKFTQAFHGSGIQQEDGTFLYMGMPAGVLLMIEGQTIYHAGDTGLFSDMKLIGELHPIDVAFLPIGDNFTMGPDDAAIAAKFLQAKTVVPIHYDTFPPIKQDPQDFVKKLESKNGRVMKAGDVIEM